MADGSHPVGALRLSQLEDVFGDSGRDHENIAGTWTWPRKGKSGRPRLLHRQCSRHTSSPARAVLPTSGAAPDPVCPTDSSFALDTKNSAIAYAGIADCCAFPARIGTAAGQASRGRGGKPPGARAGAGDRGAHRLRGFALTLKRDYDIGARQEFEDRHPPQSESLRGALPLCPRPYAGGQSGGGGEAVSRRRPGCACGEGTIRRPCWSTRPLFKRAGAKRKVARQRGAGGSPS